MEVNITNQAKYSLTKEGSEKSQNEWGNIIFKLLRGKSYYFVKGLIDHLQMRINMECFIPLDFGDDYVQK